MRALSHRIAFSLFSAIDARTWDATALHLEVRKLLRLAELDGKGSMIPRRESGPPVTV
jgi:hypothetical protein